MLVTNCLLYTNYCLTKASVLFSITVCSMATVPSGCFGGITDKRKESGKLCFRMIGCRRAAFESSKSYERVDGWLPQASYPFLFFSLAGWAGGIPNPIVPGNLQAYIPAITGSFLCSMDVQSSDGKGMLLKYVTSYVSKCHDAVKTQQLYSRDLGAYQVATSFLKNMHPLEPEMILQLTSMKIAWSNSRTKAVTAPIPDQPSPKSHHKYLNRPPQDEALPFLHWLRLYDHEKSPPKAYNGGTTLVAVKHFSPFNPLYFYQLLVMNLGH